MAKKINFGWLKDRKGERFAPKTFTHLIMDKSGTSLEAIIESLKQNSSTNSKPLFVLQTSDYITDVSLGDAVIEAALDGRSIYVVSDGAQEVHISKVTDVYLPKYYDSVGISFSNNYMSIACSYYEEELYSKIFSTLH